MNLSIQTKVHSLALVFFSGPVFFLPKVLNEWHLMVKMYFTPAGLGKGMGW